MVTLAEPLAAPKLKIERAKRHISDLRSQITAFSQRNPYRIVVEQHGDGSQHAWTIRVREEMPCDFPTFVGDAIHNLRASLDLLACDLVRINGGSIDDVCFPFCAKENELEATLQKRHINRASPDVVNMVRSLKPYHGGNDALRVIHDLDITDKHEMLIPVSNIVGIPNLTMTKGNESLLTIRNCRVGPIRDGMIILSLPAVENIKVGQEFNPAFEITFGKAKPFVKDKPLIPTLCDLTQLVDGIVRKFEAHCFGKKT